MQRNPLVLAIIIALNAGYAVTMIAAVVFG
jgi:hypothetical protein